MIRYNISCNVAAFGMINACKKAVKMIISVKLQLDFTGKYSKGTPALQFSIQYFLVYLSLHLKVTVFIL